jgi:hypothetical protein
MSPLLDDLRAIALRLRDQRPEDPAILAAERIPEYEPFRLGLGNEFLAFVIPISDQLIEFDERLRNISVQFNVKIAIDGFERRAIVLKTHSLEPWLFDAFLIAISMLLPTMSGRSDAAIVSLVRDIISLFRGLDANSSKPTIGLWGELFLISTAVDVDRAVRAWHLSPQDVHDFGESQTRLEVKTTTGIRSHHFSYNQLRPAASLQLYVASILTDEIENGISALDLIDLISDRLEDRNLGTHLLRVAMRTLGRSWSTESNRTFDPILARESLRIFDAHKIPCISTPPAELSSIHFVVDLQFALAIDTQDGDLKIAEFGLLWPDKSSTKM